MMTNNFRKKPVVIEAFQLGTHWPQDECNEWFHEAVTSGVIVTHNMGKFHNQEQETYIEIKTLEGVMRGDIGDFIIRGVKGEIYPCKPDVFEMTYEKVGNHNTSCTYQFELAFHRLQDTPELRKIYWSALGQLRFDSNDQVIPPELEECQCCKQPIIRKIGTETEGYETFDIGVDESGNRYIRHPHCEWEPEE